LVVEFFAKVVNASSVSVRALVVNLLSVFCYASVQVWSCNHSILSADVICTTHLFWCL